MSYNLSSFMKMTDPTKNYEDLDSNERYDYQQDSQSFSNEEDGDTSYSYVPNNTSNTSKIHEVFVILFFVFGPLAFLGYAGMSFSALGLTDNHPAVYYLFNGFIFLAIAAVMFVKLAKLKQDTPLLSILSLSLFAVAILMAPRLLIDVLTNENSFSGSITVISSLFASTVYCCLVIIPSYFYFRKRSDLSIQNRMIGFLILAGLISLTVLDLASNIAGISYFSGWPKALSSSGGSYRGYRISLFVTDSIIDFAIVGLFALLLIWRGSATYILPGIFVGKFVISNFRFGLTTVDRIFGYYYGAVKVFLIIKMVAAYVIIAGALFGVLYYLFEDKIRSIFYR